MTEFRIRWVNENNQWELDIYVSGKFKKKETFDTTTKMTNWIHYWQEGEIGMRTSG